MQTKYIVRWIFLVCNALFWALSILLIAFLIWVAVTDYDVIIRRTTGAEAALLYALAISAISTFITGFIGSCVGTNLNSKLLKTYIGLLVIFLLYEIAVLVTLAVDNTSSETLSFEDWKSADPSFRDAIQIEHNCCGYYGFKDHIEVEIKTRSSCYNVTVVQNPDGSNSTWYHSNQDPCHPYLESIVDNYLIVPLIIIILIVIVQIFALGFGSNLLTRLRKVVVVTQSGTKKKRHRYRFISSPFTMALEKHKRLEQEDTNIP